MRGGCRNWQRRNRSSLIERKKSESEDLKKRGDCRLRERNRRGLESSRNTSSLRGRRQNVIDLSAWKSRDSRKSD